MREGSEFEDGRKDNESGVYVRSEIVNDDDFVVNCICRYMGHRHGAT